MDSRIVDNNELYKNEIEPLLMKVRSICNENKIPYFTAFGTMVSEDGEYKKGVGLICQSLPPESMAIEVKDNKFPDFINIVNGATTTYIRTRSLDEVLSRDDIEDNEDLPEITKIKDDV
ncbi:hypothetical protein [Butyrivibrio fibrisolvens]|jgi:hypothetical protein|uniref:hypothetical protein n=1 Tax=Butyrivibrio fibrisolvens TaxID=831 RepID=UPI0003B6EA29|nr:hypothetical protein [Butyrivibrio fibrisolvens]